MDSPYSECLNPIIRFFSVGHIYTKTNTQPLNGKFNGSIPEFSLYEARQEAEYPPILIYDHKNLLTTKDTGISLRVIDEGFKPVIGEKLNYLPPAIEKKVADILKNNCVTFEEKKTERDKRGNFRTEKVDVDYTRLFLENSLLYEPIHQLKDTDILREIDWGEFIKKLLTWDAKEKDHRLNQIDKCMLMKGIEPRANPHALIVLNAGTGKSIHFIINGKNYDKVLRNSFLGFARSPTEVFKGTVDKSDLPTGLDQIEVGAWGLMDFMFNVMEYGEGFCELRKRRLHCKE